LPEIGIDNIEEIPEDYFKNFYRLNKENWDVEEDLLP